MPVRSLQTGTPGRLGADSPTQTGGTKPKLKMCLHVIQDQEQRIQELQSQLEDYRKSGHSTPRCPTAIAPEAAMKAAAKETSGEARTSQASSALPVSSFGERQEQKDYYRRDVMISIKGEDKVGEVERASDREHQTSSPPNSLFPWPKPKFRTKERVVEPYHLFEPLTDTRLPTMRLPTAARGEAIFRGCV